MESLESRLTHIERVVFGAKETVDVQKVGQSLQQLVGQIQSRFNALVQGDLKIILQGYKQNKVLIESSGPSDDVSVAAIVASKDRVTEMSRNLAQIQSLEQFIQSDSVASFQGRLAAVLPVHEVQRDAMCAWDDAIDKLIVAYEEAVIEVSAQLLRCEALVVQLEEQSKKNNSII